MILVRMWKLLKPMEEWQFIVAVTVNEMNVYK
jgi:hypothetical protein